MVGISAPSDAVTARQNAKLKPLRISSTSTFVSSDRLHAKSSRSSSDPQVSGAGPVTFARGSLTAAT